MIEFSKSYYRQRLRLRKRDDVIANKVLDFINLVGAALIFRQFFEENPFSSFRFFLGLTFTIVVYCGVWYYLSRFD